MSASRTGCQFRCSGYTKSALGVFAGGVGCRWQHAPSLFLSQADADHTVRTVGTTDKPCVQQRSRSRALEADAARSLMPAVRDGRRSRRLRTGTGGGVGGNLCQPAVRGHLLLGLELPLPGTDPSPRCRGHRASGDARGGRRVSAAAGLPGSPVRALTPCPIPLGAASSRSPIGSTDLSRPAF